MENTTSTPLRCGEAVIQWLEHHGVDTVFGIPGVHTQELYRGLAGSGIRHVRTRHEQGAGFMACGYARASGRPGVCLLITGPGVTNATTALGQAYADSLPVLLLSSENPLDTLGKGLGELHEISDQRAVTRPLTGFNALAEHPNNVPELLTQAFATFTSGRPRPAHVAIPTDVLASALEEPWLAPIKAVAPQWLSTPQTALVESAALLIREAHRPVVCVGGGAVDAADAVLALAEQCSAPVLSSHAGKGVMPASHPLSAGACMHLSGGLQLVAESDCVIAIGTELAWTDSFIERLPINGKLVRIDIDPQHSSSRYIAEATLLGDARTTVRALSVALGNHAPTSNDATARVQACRVSNEANLTPLERKHCRVLDAMQQALPSGAIVSADSTQITYTAQHAFEAQAPRRWLYGAGYCTLGAALPEAIGARLACPEEPVVAMVGDDGFMFSVQELATAVDLNLGLPVLIWNNDGLGQIKDGMDARGFEPVGVTGANPDFRLLAAAFGCAYMRPDNAETLPRELVDALDKTVPTLIEVHERDAWLELDASPRET